MSTPTNHWKLGLFVLVGFCAAIGTVLFFGVRSLQTEDVHYKSYFDESVQGLEVGSPVKFRGVGIGNVEDVNVAPDHRHIEVSYNLAVKDLNSLGLSVEKARGLQTKLKLPPDLRVQLASAGITGVKFLQLDFFDPKNYPPIQLPFAVPPNSIPTAPSVMKNLEDSVVHAVDRVPELAEGMVAVLTRVGNLLGDVEKQQLPEKAVATLAHLDAVLSQSQATLVAIEPGKLSSSARETLGNLNLSLVQLNEILGRMGGERGLVSSAHRMSDSMGSMALNANHVGPALEDTLRDVQSAALSIQRLADALERDPDMLIKGRAKRDLK